MRQIMGLGLLAVLAVGCDQLGVEGLQGPAGPEGPAGPAGPAGEDGAVDVIASNWFTLSGVQEEDRFGATYLFWTVSVPDITAEVLGGGMVVVYGKLLGYDAAFWPTDRVEQFPITLSFSFYESQLAVDHWGVAFRPGILQVELTNNQNIYGIDDVNEEHEIRYVIIPPEEVAMAADDGVDLSALPPHQLSDWFDLPEFELE